LLGELEDLLSRLLESEAFTSLAVEDSFDYFGRLIGRLPILGRFASGERYEALRERVNIACAELLSRLVSSLGEAIPRLAARMVTSLPNALLFAAVTVISGFYLCMGRREIEKSIVALLPKAIRDRAASWRRGLKNASWGYLRAYLILLLLTLAELFVGFLILGVDYAFLIALITAAVDILPVLGVGTVLIPWAAVALIQKNVTLGVGLLILFGAVSILRQILEPRIVGKSLGLHPLAALVASYVGWRIYGVVGMVAAPLVALLLKSVLGKKCGERTF
jgi:sporulation integral membrane protein YtvI